ncbi:Glucanosyltransferase-domain-containing protein [Mycena leptocephala]|nr:Glucanosyltransferase-domain-containing protein [Mycena leptocephala]KAJ7927726.1 Glucanosyltransferase-domain-containing protein [Mycena leptocephala]
MKIPGLAALASVATLVSTVGAIPKITRIGRYLYADDGTRFSARTTRLTSRRHVRPQRTHTVVDQLADSAGCTRDLPFLQTLGINAIRAYSMLSGAGIYVILDLTLPLNGSIDTKIPAWGTNVLDQYITTINTFSKYDNVLAYNVGNEVLTSIATNAAPFLKAAARDVRMYLNQSLHPPQSGTPTSTAPRLSGTDISSAISLGRTTGRARWICLG